MFKMYFNADELRKHAVVVNEATQKRERAKVVAAAKDMADLVSVISKDPQKYIDDNYGSKLRGRCFDGQFSALVYDYHDCWELIAVIVDHLKHLGFFVSAKRQYKSAGTDVNSGRWQEGYHYYKLTIEWGNGNGTNSQKEGGS